MSFTSEQAPERSTRGFTLVEIMISLTILTFVVAGILSSLMFLQRACYDLEAHTQVNERARTTVDQLGADLRSAVDLVEANSEKLKIVIEDVHGNQDVVTYTYLPGAKGLVRSDSDSNKRYLISQLESFSFIYHTSRNTPASNPIDIKKVSVQFRQKPDLKRSDNDGEYTSARFLMRNRLAS